MRNPVDHTILIQKAIKNTVLTGKPELLTDSIWSAFYETLYQPLTEIFDSEVVWKQFIRDKYLIKKGSLQRELEKINLRIKAEDISFDDREFRRKLEYSADFRFHKPWFDSPLDEAVFHHDLQRCFNLLTHRPRYALVINSKGYAPLHDVVASNNFPLLKLLCNFTVPIDIQTKNNKMTPLHLAAAFNDVVAVRLLLAKGAKVDMSQIDGRTSLHLALHSLEIVKILIAQGAKIDVQDNEGYTPLHIAVEQGHLETAQFLFEMGADPLKITHAGKSVFDFIPPDKAALFQFLHDKKEIDKTCEKALLCFEHVANIRIFPKESVEAINEVSEALLNLRLKDAALSPPKSANQILAVRKPESAVPQISAGSFFSNPVSPEYQDALVEACRNADLAAVKKYIHTHKANPLLPDSKGRYALSEAIWSLAPDIVSWLLKEQNPPFTKDDLNNMFMSIKNLYKVESVFPVPSRMKTFYDWYRHCNDNHAAWFYNYAAVKKRETNQCPVLWNTVKHATFVTLPLGASENSPFIKLEFTAGGRFVVSKTEVYRSNEIADYPEYFPQIKWIQDTCNHMKTILQTHGIIIKNDYSLDRITGSDATNLAMK